MTYLVDSDWVVDFLKGRPPAVALLASLFSQGLAISIVSYAEVYEGIYYGHDRAHYEGVYREFLRGVRVLGINQATARRFAVIRGLLRSGGQLIPEPDVFIAATAIQHGLTLVTRNRKDFARIPELLLRGHAAG